MADLLWPSHCTCPGLLGQCDLLPCPQTNLILVCSLPKVVFSFYFVFYFFFSFFKFYPQGLLLLELATSAFCRQFLLRLLGPHSMVGLWHSGGSFFPPSLLVTSYSSQPVVLECPKALKSAIPGSLSTFSPIALSKVVEQGNHPWNILDSPFPLISSVIKSHQFPSYYSNRNHICPHELGWAENKEKHQGNNWPKE